MAETSERHSPEQEATWVGSKLDDIGGATAGWVEGVFADSESAEPAWLVYRIGRIGRRTAVPFEFVVGGAGRVWVPFERDHLRRAPEVDPAAGLTPEREIALCEHYGIPAGVRRRAELEGREDEPLTAVPGSGG